MQVDRQPSPWPCVVMLVGLLLICLTVPSYWQDDREPGDSPDLAADHVVADATSQSANDAIGWAFAFDDPYVRFDIAGFSNPSVGIPNGAPAEHDLLSFVPVPTIEELIAARMGAPRLDDAALDWPVIVPSTATHDRMPPVPRPAPAAAAPGPLESAAFEQVGQAIGSFSRMEVAPRLAAVVVGVYRVWSAACDSIGESQSAAVAEATSPAASTLRLLGPDDRLAMVPPAVASEPNDLAPNIAPEPGEINLRIASDPWCVPRVLFDQLERLARHPNSARWAELTMAQLHSLTERDRLEGDDVQAILAALSDSTLAAVRMADETDEDRLRVALLRAHWGLARRLDRWAVVHDIRVAELSRDRVASRGSLGSLFEGIPASTAERTDTLALTTDLENYEQTRDPRLGREVVREQRILESSPDSLDRALADAVEQHYRNANVRVAISVAMLNRFAGQERSEVRTLRDRIAGTPVQGRSYTQSESRVRLDPATGRWQMELEAQGLVDSDTVADGGQARLRSHSATDFAARKRIVVDSDGVLIQPASIDVTGHNRLVGVTTDFDWVPLFGSYARDRATQQYRARQTRARLEIESRVSARALEQIDGAARDAVDRIEQQFREHFTDRLAESGIKVTPVEMTTTHERVVARLRVAGDDQLGSHTPRPRALSDSLASVQVHETALTNVAVSLALDGRRYTAEELQSLFRQKFPQMTLDSAAAHRDTVFHFAAEDAMQFHIDGGRLELTLALVSVEQDGRSMRDFVVHAFYTPVVDGLEAALVREGSLGIEGRLSSAQRARLHNVFNSVLPPERPLPIVRLDDANDERLAGLMITQLVLEDGWLGLAVGPASSERVAERSRSLR